MRSPFANPRHRDTATRIAALPMDCFHPIGLPSHLLKRCRILVHLPDTFVVLQIVMRMTLKGLANNLEVGLPGVKQHDLMSN